MQAKRYHPRTKLEACKPVELMPEANCISAATCISGHHAECPSEIGSGEGPPLGTEQKSLSDGPPLYAGLRAYKYRGCSIML